MTGQDWIMLVESRDAIRNALLHSIRMEKIVSKAIPHTALSPALAAIRAGTRADIVFISNSFPIEDVLKFVSSAKNCAVARDSAFILLMDQSRQTATSVARQLLRGMDGFLSYPFNVEAVQSTVRIALGVKSQRLKARIEFATKMLLNEISKELDHITYDAKCAHRDPILPSSLKEAAHIAHAFKGEELTIYYKALFEIFEHALPSVEFIETQGHSESGYSDEIRSVFEMLESNSSFANLRAIRYMEAHKQQLAPYIEEIRKRVDRADPRIKERTESIIASIHP